MNHLVQIISNDDGDFTPTDKLGWCLAVFSGGGYNTLCTGEFFGDGEGIATYKEKHTKRGGITCPKCLSMIKDFKAIKL